MTLEETLKALKSAFSNKSAEAEAHAKEIAELKAKNDTLAAEFAAVAEKLEASAGAVAERDELKAKVEELLNALASTEKKKNEAVTQIESVGKKAAVIIAAAGATPVEITAGNVENGKAKTGAEIWEEYLKMPQSKEKQAFYLKHRSAIVEHLGYK
jgi:chromosome segregation ATPase